MLFKKIYFIIKIFVKKINCIKQFNKMIKVYICSFYLRENYENDYEMESYEVL